jgi:hypothetical protein
MYSFCETITILSIIAYTYKAVGGFIYAGVSLLHRGSGIAQLLMKTLFFEIIPFFGLKVMFLTPKKGGFKKKRTTGLAPNCHFS